MPVQAGSAEGSSRVPSDQRFPEQRAARSRPDDCRTCVAVQQRARRGNWHARGRELVAEVGSMRGSGRGPRRGSSGKRAFAGQRRSSRLLGGCRTCVAALQGACRGSVRPGPRQDSSGVVPAGPAKGSSRVSHDQRAPSPGNGHPADCSMSPEPAGRCRRARAVHGPAGLMCEWSGVGPRAAGAHAVTLTCTGRDGPAARVVRDPRRTSADQRIAHSPPSSTSDCPRP